VAASFICPWCGAFRSDHSGRWSRKGACPRWVGPISDVGARNRVVRFEATSRLKSDIVHIRKVSPGSVYSIILSARPSSRSGTLIARSRTAALSFKRRRPLSRKFKSRPTDTRPADCCVTVSQCARDGGVALRLGETAAALLPY
jgi:hypothetical protein